LKTPRNIVAVHVAPVRASYECDKEHHERHNRRTANNFLIDTHPIRRRIEAAELMLAYESPDSDVALAKAFLERGGRRRRWSRCRFQAGRPENTATQ
jgi:hypothetical protein